MAAWRGRLQALWYRPTVSPGLWCLWPVERLFVALAWLRRAAYERHFFRSHRLERPVVVVGNLSVGGTGKTPLVVWLAGQLSASGRSPGIVSRGFGGRGTVRAVDAGSNPAEVGDEPTLLAARTGLPVVVGRDRVAAGQALVAAHPEVDVILCDDGLQHYRLHRDVEIAVVDGRGFGNGRRLPLGPLREAVDRLETVDAVVFNGRAGEALAPASANFAMSLCPQPFVSLDDPGRHCAASEFAGRRLCAIAGIGDPPRFFAQLRVLGLEFEARAFPDHHAYAAGDLAFAVGRVLLMTEKDAVKCRGLFAGEAWFLPVAAQVEPDLAAFVLEKLHGRKIA